MVYQEHFQLKTTNPHHLLIKPTLQLTQQQLTSNPTTTLEQATQNKEIYYKTTKDSCIDEFTLKISPVHPKLI